MAFGVDDALGLGFGLIGGLKSLFGGKSYAEKLAEGDIRARMARSEQAWKMAKGNFGRAERYFAPIAGGSREAALEAAAPEIKASQERMDKGRQTLFDLAPRSGGAGAMLDPYAKDDEATDILTAQRPKAAAQLGNMAGMAGGWSQNMGQDGSRTLFANERARKAEEAEAGAGFYDVLERTIPGLASSMGTWFKGQKVPNSAPGFTVGGLSKPWSAYGR